MANIAIQLYTLRDLLDQDFAGTLRKVSEIGYSAVELHTYGGLSPEQLRALLDELNLQAVSSHVALTRIETELEAVIAEAQTIGFHYVVCPWLPEERRNEYSQLANTLSEAGKRCAEAGLQLAYHNHDFELLSSEATLPLDALFQATDAKQVQAELDLYWVHRAGQDPVTYVNRYAGRLDLLHMKDVSSADGSFETVGQGILDWPQIIAAAKAVGVKWYIVEQDVCVGDPLESIAASLAFLVRNLS